MHLFFWKEKPLRTIWKVEKAGCTSFLVGTAHFSPYSFKKSLTRLIQDVETVLFEGPLDEEEHGQGGSIRPAGRGCSLSLRGPSACRHQGDQQAAGYSVGASYHGRFLFGTHPPDDCRSCGELYARRSSLDDFSHRLVCLFELEAFDGFGGIPNRSEAWEKDPIS